jgi:hypothetical protein
MNQALTPAERMALTVAATAVLEGREPGPNTAAACILALGRLTGYLIVEPDGTYSKAAP